MALCARRALTTSRGTASTAAAAEEDSAAGPESPPPSLTPTPNPQPTLPSHPTPRPQWCLGKWPRQTHQPGRGEGEEKGMKEGGLPDDRRPLPGTPVESRATTSPPPPSFFLPSDTHSPPRVPPSLPPSFRLPISLAWRGASAARGAANRQQDRCALGIDRSASRSFPAERG